MEIEMPDPLCLVVENMPYEDFMVRTSSPRRRSTRY